MGITFPDVNIASTQRGFPRSIFIKAIHFPTDPCDIVRRTLDALDPAEFFIHPEKKTRRIAFADEAKIPAKRLPRIQ
ncbi:hypothetical protein, partial [Sphingobium sp. BS19]|uniref:hypothetical protein n=1 Tax=Sphingobium sp. BS19 TaxID=3018973 RepID=UPI00248F6B22